ncbi:MAG: hypothetical protein COT59_02115 [Candidatus Nealsonbacteria bacterium CG09_land_8_20_14_0_10_42_14]|uniref:Uncharacterized protein n=1 Tax=Candidatus Nealsonbacteria bacterium CG09_land_8_20_14_0_10_42_14 TaxID=1974707 RepID=A0A2H0WZ18_9BACT|nr:MAG: hypothetical protein COT59_02115 [Candidatus Nealsonbacteria bacterium CG09_land_8_20_14_0_10_42_14]
MTIKESKNLKQDKVPRTSEYYGDEGIIDPDFCLLESFNRVDDRLDLFFKNKSQARISAKNVEGGKELDVIEQRLENFIGKSYREIIEAEF